MAGTLSADRSRVVGREADFVSPQTTISKGSGVLLEDDPRSAGRTTPEGRFAVTVGRA
jgi:hypothetical protein